MHAIFVVVALTLLPSAAIAADILAIDRDGGRLHIVDIDTFTLRHSVAVGAAPHEVTASSDGRSAWVALYGDAHDAGHGLVELDLATGTIARRIDTAPLLRPHGLVRAGDNIYFTAEANRVVARLNPAEGRIDRVYGIGRDATHMLEIAADGQQLVTTDIVSGSVSRLDFRGKTALPTLRHYDVGDKPEGLALQPDGRHAWVGLNGEGIVRVLDLDSGEIVASLPAGSYPARIELSRDGRDAYVIDPQTSRLLVFDTATRTQRHAHVIDGVPLGMAAAATPGRLYVTLAQAGAIAELDVEHGTVLRRVDVGQVADGIALAEPS